MCHRCLHPTHEDAEDGSCEQCKDDAASSGGLKKGVKCAVRCPLPHCRHAGSRTTHRAKGCSECSPGDGCNALAEHLAAAKKAAAATASVHVAAADHGEAATNAATTADAEGDELDYGQLEDDEELEVMSGLVQQLERDGQLGEAVEIVGSANGAPEDEVAAVTLELSYIQDEQEGTGQGEGDEEGKGVDVMEL